MVPAAEEITQNRIQPAAKMVAEQAVPTAKEFTEGQLKPAAQAVAENVRRLHGCQFHPDADASAYGMSRVVLNCTGGSRMVGIRARAVTDRDESSSNLNGYSISTADAWLHLQTLHGTGMPLAPSDRSRVRATIPVLHEAPPMCSQAEPLAREIVDTKLMPAAEAIAEQAEPQAQRFNEEVIIPRGQQLAEQVCHTGS